MKALLPRLGALVILATAPLVQIESAQAGSEVIIAGSQPPGHYLVQKVYIPWTEEVERRSNGEVSFKWNHAGKLFKFGQNPDAVKEGRADMAEMAGFFFNESTWPVTSVFAMPFLFESTLQANLTYLDALKEIPEFAEEYKGLKILGLHNSDFSNFHMAKGHKAPANLADFKGLRIAVSGGTSIKIIELIGAVPSDVAIADRYLTLQRGEADGQIWPTAALAVPKFDEISDAHAIVNMKGVPLPGIMNQKTFDGLPEAAREAIDDMVISWTRFTGCVVDNRRQVMLNKLMKRGDDIKVWEGQQLKSLRGAAEPVFDDWISKMKEHGIDGMSILQKVREIAKRHAGADNCEPDSWWPDDAFVAG